MCIRDRVGQESHGKNKIRVRRYSVLETEGNNAYYKIIIFPVLHKNSVYFFLQLAGQQLGSIYDLIRLFFHGGKDFPFPADAALNPVVLRSSQGVYPAAFLITLHQGCICLLYTSRCV